MGLGKGCRRRTRNGHRSHDMGARKYGCSTVVLICFTCPAITVVTVILKALDRVRERALGCFARSPKSPPNTTTQKPDFDLSIFPRCRPAPQIHCGPLGLQRDRTAAGVRGLLVAGRMPLRPVRVQPVDVQRPRDGVHRGSSAREYVDVGLTFGSCRPHSALCPTCMVTMCTMRSVGQLTLLTGSMYMYRVSLRERRVEG